MAFMNFYGLQKIASMDEFESAFPLAHLCSHGTAFIINIYNIIFFLFLKIRWGLEILKSMEFIEDKFTAVEYPFFIMHGEQDKICSVDGSQTMYDQAKSTDKTIKVNNSFL